MIKQKWQNQPMKKFAIEAYTTVIVITRNDEVLDFRILGAHVISDVDQVDGAVRLVASKRHELSHAEERVERLVQHQRARQLHAVQSHDRALGTEHQSRLGGRVDHFRVDDHPVGPVVPMHAHRLKVPFHLHGGRLEDFPDGRAHHRPRALALDHRHPYRLLLAAVRVGCLRDAVRGTTDVSSN